MPRYIDANKLIDLATHEGAYGYVDVHDIRNTPTADVVEVVRCKDCNFCNIYDDTDLMFCRVFNIFVRSDFFCQDGKRRKDNGNDD